ncbi:hypothetical protein JZ751_029928 [Albula glossodonta]|uniref:Uncharacterized protein n=1 Tax=Albula glossodonta TaxID=121402 RepID=A0A8T2NDT5_9TELE|nr:hypothetical protein JZ751_029928 [Albula glossodonta]
MSLVDVAKGAARVELVTCATASDLRKRNTPADRSSHFISPGFRSGFSRMSRINSQRTTELLKTQGDLKVLEQEGAHRPGRLSEILKAHAAELVAVYVEVLEGDAGGVDLVHVQRLLQPFPHLELGPELRLGILGPGPARVARHHGGR